MEGNKNEKRFKEGWSKKKGRIRWNETKGWRKIRDKWEKRKKQKGMGGGRRKMKELKSKVERRKEGKEGDCKWSNASSRKCIVSMKKTEQVNTAAVYAIWIPNIFSSSLDYDIAETRCNSVLTHTHTAWRRWLLGGITLVSQSWTPWMSPYICGNKTMVMLERIRDYMTHKVPAGLTHPLKCEMAMNIP
jgi:hypothetical protein